MGFPGGSVHKEYTCNVGPGLDPCVGNIPWRRAWQPIPVFLTEEFPWTEDPGRLPMGQQKIRHDSATKHNQAHNVIQLLWNQRERERERDVMNGCPFTNFKASTRQTLQASLCLGRFQKPWQKVDRTFYHKCCLYVIFGQVS